MLVQQREVLRELTGLEVPENSSLQRIDPTDKEKLMVFEEMITQFRGAPLRMWPRLDL